MKLKNHPLGKNPENVESDTSPEQMNHFWMKENH